MSAVFDTLRMDTMLYRNGEGFTTTKLPGLALDLTSLANSKTTGIERISLVGMGNNQLTLNVLDLFDLSDTDIRIGASTYQLAERSADTTTVSARVTMLDPVAPIGEGAVVAYRQTSDAPFTSVDLIAWIGDALRVVQSKTYVVRVQHASTTMLPFSRGRNVIDEEAEEAEDIYRDMGVSFVRVPPKRIHSFQMRIEATNVTQNLPRVRLITHLDDEDDG